MALLVVKMYLKAKDLDDAWRKINVGCMTGKVPCKSISVSRHFIVDGEIICSVENKGCNLDLNNFGYQDRKLQLLYNKYFDQEQWDVFNNLVLSGKNTIYYFKSSKVYAGLPKANCLICLMYDNRNDEYTIVWRQTELLARFAADLVFLSKILLDKKLRLVILGAYQYIVVIYGIFKMNGVRFKKPKDEKYAKAVVMSKEFFPDHIDFEFYERWQPIKLVQKSYKRYLKRKES